MSKHAHLIKVMVQTVWVVVDDDTGIATEMADSGVAIPAAEWEGFYSRHCADFAAIQEATAAEPAVVGPNRVQRRAKSRAG